MINTSNEYKEYLAADKRAWIEVAEVHFKDDPTVVTLTNENFWNNGFSVEDATSSDSNFEIGTAIVNKANFTINNLTGAFDDYDFTNAVIYCRVQLQLSSRTETLHKGVYVVNNATYYNGIISLECYDKMSYLDRPYTESQLVYPATLLDIVRNACSMCDVTLNTPSFPHYNYVIQNAPDKESTTFREVVSWVTQIAGCFARMNGHGQLELKWYKQDALDDITVPNANRHEITQFYGAPHVSVDPVVISGVRIEVKTAENSSPDAIKTYTRGTSAYVIAIANNPFITEANANTIIEWLATQLIGFRFYQANFSHSSDPSIEAGDVAAITDRLGKKFPVVISRTTFKYGSAQMSVSAAQTPARNSAARISAETKNYVELRKKLLDEETDRETMYEELSERISESTGLYTTEETSASGTIFYMHDMPTLAESQIIWKMTTEAWGVSTDGGETWNAGMTVDGDTIVRILSARGINAGWIDTGVLSVKKQGGLETLYVNVDTGSVRIVADDIKVISGGEAVDVMEAAQDVAEESAQEVIKGLRIGGVNMLRGTNTTTELGNVGTWTESTWRLVSETAGLSSYYGDCESITAHDAPNNNIRLGWRCTTKKEEDPDSVLIPDDDSFQPAYGGLAQDRIPVVTGQEYTISAYIRGVGKLSFSYGTDEYVTKEWTINVKKWTQVSWTVRLAAGAGNIYVKDNQTNVIFMGKAGQNQYVDVCGMQLELGNRCTDWKEAPSYLEDYMEDEIGRFNAELNQEEILKRLTNNFQVKGLYLEKGELYVNATYIKTGKLNIKDTLTLGGIIKDSKGNNKWNLDTGVMDLKLNSLKVAVKDAKGNVSYVNVSPNDFRMKSSGTLTWTATNSSLTKNGTLTAKNVDLNGIIKCVQPNKDNPKNIDQGVEISEGQVNFYYLTKWVGKIGGVKNDYIGTGTKYPGMAIQIADYAKEFAIEIPQKVTQNKKKVTVYRPIFMYTKQGYTIQPDDSDMTFKPEVEGAYANTLNAYRTLDMHWNKILHATWGRDGRRGRNVTFQFKAPTAINSKGVVTAYDTVKMEFITGVLVGHSWKGPAILRYGGVDALPAKKSQDAYLDR